MTILNPRENITLNTQTLRVQTVRVNIGVLTNEVLLRLRRPTTASPLAWNASAQIRLILVVEVDGIEYRCQGSTSGGIRTNILGQEIPEYVLRYRLPVRMDEGRAKRLGEGRSNTPQAYIIVERVRGNIATEILQAETSEADPPIWTVHHSIAFDAATDAVEISGDGVLSLTHTSTGANRVVFGGGGNSDDPPRASSSMTYGGTGMTNMWDVGPAAGDFGRNAGYQLVNQATGAQTVTHTLGGAIGEHGLAVVSLTGVHQSTPVGTPATVADNDGGTTITVTVGSLNADDLIVDFLYTACNGGATEAGSGPDANQTERTQEVYEGGGFSLFFGSSTQSGADGGVMSWTTNVSQSFAGTLGAVAFKAAAEGGSLLFLPRLQSLQATMRR